jgi:hypothetical protein
VLLVVGRDPWPTRRGDQLRALQFASALAEEWEVTLLAPLRSGSDASPEAPPGVRVKRYARTLGDRLLGLLRAAAWGEPLQTGLFASRDLRRKLAAEAAESSLVVVQLVRAAEAFRILRGVRGGDARPVLVDFIDCLSLAFDRRAAVEHAWRRPALRHEARRLARAEAAALSSVAGGAVVCGRDREALIERAGGAAALAAKLAVLPLAIPSGPPPDPRRAAERPVIALTGNLGYFVNRDAVRWFLERVWPMLRGARPDLRLLVAGARATGLAGALRSAGAEVLADPADLRAVLGAATVALAPLRCGAGVPVKVLEAWAVGTPVVASAWAAAGAEGVPERELLVADEPAEWLRQIERLLDDPALRMRLATAGRARLERWHSPQSAAAAIRMWARDAATLALAS